MKQEVRRVQDEEDAGAKELRMWLFLLLLGVMPYAAAWGQEASEQDVVRQETSEYAESHSKGKLLTWLNHLFDKLSVSKSDKHQTADGHLCRHLWFRLETGRGTAGIYTQFSSGLQGRG